MRRLAAVLALVTACAPAAQPVPPTLPPATSTPVIAALSATPVVVWTAPAQTLRPSLTESPPPVPPPGTAAVTTAPSTPSPPAPTPPPTSPPTARPATPKPTPSLDPLRWTRYRSPEIGTVIYVPASWTPIAPATLAARGMDFGASPESGSLPFLQFKVLVTLTVIDASFTDVKVFADYIVQSLGRQMTREEITLPSGPAVVLKYQLQLPGQPALQQADVLLLHGPRSFALGLRAPVDSLARNAPILDEVMRRFQPG